ncbi:MAG: hypothetical protein H0U41_05045, partial [Actinobacteria bacterium]|nr:hypothetical protein [Actinomycetota bacterium]
LEETASGLDIIREAYSRERKTTDRKFVIRLTNGRLEVVPFGRNRTIYVLDDEALGRSFQTQGKEHPVTVIEGHAKVGKGKAAKKIKHTEFRRRAVRRLGYVAREKDYGRVKTRAALRRLCRRDLAEELRVTRTGSFSFPGIPFLRRGDAMRVVTPEPGWSGREREVSRNRSFCFVTAATHTVSGGEYVTSVEVNQKDPYQADEARLDKLARERARKARKDKKEEAA